MSNLTCPALPSLPVCCSSDAGGAVPDLRDGLQLHGRVRDQVPVGHLARHPGQLPPHHHLGHGPAHFLRAAAQHR